MIGTSSWTQVEQVEPAIKGTRNVLNACLKAKVKKVVVVSSVAAVLLNPCWPKDQPMDENCWSDTEFCKSTKVSLTRKYMWKLLALYLYVLKLIFESYVEEIGETAEIIPTVQHYPWTTI